MHDEIYKIKDGIILIVGQVEQVLAKELCNIMSCDDFKFKHIHLDDLESSISEVAGANALDRWFTPVSKPVINVVSNMHVMMSVMGQQKCLSVLLNFVRGKSEPTIITCNEYPFTGGGKCIGTLKKYVRFQRTLSESSDDTKTEFCEAMSIELLELLTMMSVSLNDEDSANHDTTDDFIYQTCILLKQTQRPTPVPPNYKSPD